MKIQFAGQVERDPAGLLWAVLYRVDRNGTQTISHEQVRTLRQGKRRVTDMVLAAYDNSRVQRR